MTRGKRNTYLALLGLGFAGLLADRLFFAEPQSASASDVPTLVGGGEAAEQTIAGGASADIAAAAFPRNLNTRPADAPSRDAFALTDEILIAMGGAPLRQEGEAADTNGPAEALPAATFAVRHRLFAVLTGGDADLAIVDGRPIRIGDKLDGCELVSLIGRSAEFACPSGDVVLSVSDEDQSLPR